MIRGNDGLFAVICFCALLLIVIGIMLMIMGDYDEDYRIISTTGRAHRI